MKATLEQFITGYVDQFGAYGDEEVEVVEGLVVKLEYDQYILMGFEWLPKDCGIDLSNKRNTRNIGAECPVNVTGFLHWYYNEQRSIPCREMTDFDRQYHWLPVYCYDHSGVRYNTTGFSCPWDSGVAGIAFIKKSAATEYGIHGIMKSWPASRRQTCAYEYLRGEVTALDDMSSGNCYQWSLVQGENEVIDACAGYLGGSGRKAAIEDALATAFSFVTETTKSS